MKFPKKIWVNGRLADPRRPALSVFDRGFLYGDGIYETLRVYGGRLFRFDEHFGRLQSSARAVRFTIPASRAALRAAAEKTVAANGLREATVRFTLTRGVGPLGFAPGARQAPTLTVIAMPTSGHPEHLYEDGIAVALVSVRRNSRRALDPAVKSTNNLNNILAKMESLAAGAYEALMLNPDGYLAEGTISNIFFSGGGALKTPSPDCGLLSGVTRAAVMALAGGRDIPVVEGRYRPRDLFAAREIFLTSTTLEVMPVTTLIDEDGRRHRVGTGAAGPWARALRSDFRRLVRSETGGGPR